ncbi:MBL fold metallo-hydrolase [Salinibacterium sp. SYSU T00001]|uniref:MBL fold metallo-hydrolase n=1 Tax=Homoserinimonas sedimenticola TaxID=2986805 RepID=UPI002235D3D2|nr:MBL fold metallo-hydrolase [Salinibacterium sedimenticola]MCW4386387.1 MBL fold metallo-hydrolase [Salinibacterium sedimenticola]
MTLLHDLEHVVIRRIAVSEMDNNVYLLTAKATGAQLLIDAADDMSAIERMLREARRDSPEPTRLSLIITTHRHADHTRALAELAAATGALTAAGSEDADAIEDATGTGIDIRLDHGDAAELDGLSLTAIPLRGHTPGSIALAYGDPAGPTHLFTGDSLFPGGVGNTQGDPERFASLLGDVTERLFAVYDDATLVHPGHGLGTTLGAERPHLEEWRARGW